MAGGPFVAVNGVGEGRLVAVSDALFFVGSPFLPEVGLSDNPLLWRNMLLWVSGRV